MFNRVPSKSFHLPVFAVLFFLVNSCRTTDDQSNVRDDSAPDPAMHHIEIDQKLPHLSNSKIDVQSYDVKLRFDKFALTSIPAEVSIAATLHVASSDIRFHINQDLMAIGSVEVDRIPGNFEILDGIDGDSSYGLKGDVLRVPFADEKPAGSSVNIKLVYTVKSDLMNRSEGIMFREEFGDPIFVTRNWPYYTRFWLPTNDHPGDTATLAVELETPADGIGAANGYLVEGTYRDGSGLNAEGFRVFKWKQPTPIPTYAINVTVGKFQIEQQDYCYDPAIPGNDVLPCRDGLPRIPYVYYLRPHHPKKAQFIQAAQSGIKAAILFSKLLGTYPYDKLGFVTAPHPFNMESVSLMIMTSPSATVHEVLHHWWGDTVYIKHWGDFWISEGFTTYFTGLYDEVISGQNTSCSQSDGRLNNPSDTDPMTIFDNVSYCKGAAALHDLRVRIAALANLQDEAASLDLFLSLGKQIFLDHRFKLLGSEDLPKYLKRVLPSLLNGMPQQTIDDAVNSWQQVWLPD